MKRAKRIISVLLASLTAAAFVACSDGDNTDNTPAEVSMTVSVQNSIMVKGGSNAFTVDAQNLDGDAEISYQLALKSGSYQTVKTTTARNMVYRCDTVGDYTVRVSVAVADEKVYSNEVDFSVVEAGGDTFGNSPAGDAYTSGVDIYGDVGENPSIEHKSLEKRSDEYAFVKGVQETRFFFQAKVDILGANDGDPYPKTGLFVKSGSRLCYFAFDVRPNFSSKEVVFVTYTDDAWNWPGTVWTASDAVFRDAQNNRRGNFISILRDATTFYLAVNGEYLGKVTVNTFVSAAHIGTYTMSQNAIFSDYSYYEGRSSEYAEELARAKAEV